MVYHDLDKINKKTHPAEYVICQYENQIEGINTKLILKWYESEDERQELINRRNEYLEQIELYKSVKALLKKSNAYNF